jgi:sulfatase modifying factor 1
MSSKQTTHPMPAGPTKDMVWVPGGVPGGVRRPLPGGGPGPPGQRGPVLDRPPPGHQRRLRPLRPQHRARDGSRTGPDPADSPGARPELLVPASMVFRTPGAAGRPGWPYQGWTYVPGADWRHPQGPASSINKRPDHPVVQVDGAAVAAEAGGAGKQRPGEAHGSWRPGVGWRGHLRRGEVAPSRGRGMATTWQGEFPNQNLELDGYGGRRRWVGSRPTATACST